MAIRCNAFFRFTFHPTYKRQFQEKFGFIFFDFFSGYKKTAIGCSSKLQKWLSQPPIATAT